MLGKYSVTEHDMFAWFDVVTLHKLQSSRLLERNEMVQVMLVLLLQSMGILKESLFHVELHQDILTLTQEQWSLQQSMKQYETQSV